MRNRVMYIQSLNSIYSTLIRYLMLCHKVFILTNIPVSLYFILYLRVFFLFILMIYLLDIYHSKTQYFKTSLNRIFLTDDTRIYPYYLYSTLYGNLFTNFRKRSMFFRDCYFTLKSLLSSDSDMHVNSKFKKFKWLIIRARKIVTKFHNYSYEIVMSPVIVNSYKNGHNSYQIVK